MGVIATITMSSETNWDGLALFIDNKQDPIQMIRVDSLRMARLWEEIIYDINEDPNKSEYTYKINNLDYTWDNETWRAVYSVVNKWFQVYLTERETLNNINDNGIDLSEYGFEELPEDSQ